MCSNDGDRGCCAIRGRGSESAQAPDDDEYHRLNEHARHVPCENRHDHGYYCVRGHVHVYRHANDHDRDVAAVYPFLTAELELLRT